MSVQFSENSFGWASQKGYNLKDPIVYWAQIDAIRECAKDGGKACRIRLLISTEFKRDADSEVELLLSALGRDTLDDLRMLLSQKFPPWAASNSQWTPIHEAAYNGQYDGLVELLKNVPDGILARLVDNQGNTPLHVALLRRARGKSVVDVVDRLLQHGAPPNVRNRVGLLPLHLAVLRGDPAALTVLLGKSKEGVGKAAEMALAAVGRKPGPRTNPYRRKVVDVLQRALGKSQMDQIRNALSMKRCLEMTLPVAEGWQRELCGASRLQYRPLGGHYGLEVIEGR
ncbi:MAG: ankyrin repeat domain-containing protein [Gemmatimonadota bacterium]|nr:ankyrin repeat domain-containing protein [Gemmatimonadota bacterium]